MTPLPRRVVAPDVVAWGALRDGPDRELLRLWRDGRIQLVQSRQLLRSQLETLAHLGLPEPLLRHWRRWLTAPEKVQWVPLELPPPARPPQLCLGLLRAAGHDLVIATHLPPPPGGPPDTWAPPDLLLP